MANNELNFSVQLQLLSEGFNRGVRDANRNFGNFETQMQRYMKAMNENTGKAQEGFDQLFNSSGDNLINEFNRLTTELNSMGEGARIAETDVQRAFSQMQSHVAGLENNLTEARSELKRLEESNITPEDIERAQAKVSDFENKIIEARNELVRLQNTNATPEDIQKAQNEITELENKTSQAHAELVRLSNSRVTPEDMERALNRVSNLETSLESARSELVRLQNTNATPEDIQRAQREIESFENDLVDARNELGRLQSSTVTPDDILRAQNQIRDLEGQLVRSTRAAEDFGRASSDSMDRARQSSENAQTAIHRLLNIQTGTQLESQIDQINRELNEFGNLTGRSGDEWNRVSREAAAEIERLERQLRGLNDETRDVGENAERELGKFSGGVNKAKNAFAGLQGLLAAAGLGIGVAEIIETSDAFKTLEARVKLATGEGAAFVSGFQGVTEIANATFASVESTGELFSRISVAAKEMNLAQEEILSVTQTINEAIKLSGGSAEAADAAITQLIQGLQSGVVRGEEFNSIMEQAPRLAQAMADGLGVTRGELRALAQEGALTSEVVINAVKSQTKTIADEFETLPTTVGNSIQLLQNKFFTLIGGIDKTVNQSSKLAQAINYVSENIDNMDPATMESINFIFNEVLGVLSTLFTTLGDVYSSFSDLTSIFDSSREDVGFLTARIQELSLALGTVNDGLKTISILADSTFGTVSLLAGGIVSAFAAMKGETSELADELFAEAEESFARADKKVMEFESSTVSAWNNINKTSQDRLNESAVKMGEVYDNMVAKGTASTGALEAQFMKLAEARIRANNNMIDEDLKYELSQKNLQAIIGETGEITISAIDQSQVSFNALGNSFAEIAIKAKETGTSIEESLAQMLPTAKTREAVDDIVLSLTLLSEQGRLTNEELANGINLTNERYKEIEKQIDVNIKKFGEYAQKVIKENGGIITAELQHAASLENLAVQMTDTGSILVTELDKSTVSANKTKQEIDELANSVGLGLSSEFSKARENVISLSENFKDLESSGYAAGEALIKSLNGMTSKAQNTSEIENIILLWKELGKEGKLTGEDLAAGLDLANDRLNALTDGVNSVNEAYKVLGLTTRAEAAKQAETYSQAYGLILNDGTATARQLQSAFEKTARAQIAANGDVIDSTTRAQAAQRGLTVEVDESGRVIFRRMGEVKQSIDRLPPSLNNVSSSFFDVGRASNSASNQMISNAQRVENAYNKLQSKIQQVKQEQALEKADETLRNLRQYGKEVAPVQVNQFGSKTAVENFLKSAGLSSEQAMEETRKLYSKQGGGSGALNFGELQGFQDGQIMTTSDLTKYKSASVFLLEIAEKVRYQQKSKTPGPSLDSYANSQYDNNQGRSNYNLNSEPSKTVRLDLSYNGKEVPMRVEGNNDNSLNDILNQIERDKMLSGLN